MNSQMPTAEMLLLSANAYEHFRTCTADIIRQHALFQDSDAFRDTEPVKLARIYKTLFAQAWDQINVEFDLSALNWLENQPAFRMAYESLGLYQLTDDEDLARLEARIRRRRALRFSPWQIADLTGGYLRYMCGICLELYNYVTGRGVSATINGPVAIKRMTDLITEFQRLASEDFFPQESQKALLSHSNRLLDRLHRSDFLPSPVTRRNDRDLPARVVATGLIRLHLRHYGEGHKRAVFHLMGLPFIERLLEMRTIERLIKAEQERRTIRPRQK
ncbi:MAG TPA: hypothetical protein DHV63_09620 [Pseudomonas sp.]|nr:hypothetical protein [Pseudomonas sp.]